MPWCHLKIFSERPVGPEDRKVDIRNEDQIGNAVESPHPFLLRTGHCFKGFLEFENQHASLLLSTFPLDNPGQHICIRSEEAALSFVPRMALLDVQIHYPGDLAGRRKRDAIVAMGLHSGIRNIMAVVDTIRILNALGQSRPPAHASAEGKSRAFFQEIGGQALACAQYQHIRFVPDKEYAALCLEGEPADGNDSVKCLLKDVLKRQLFHGNPEKFIENRLQIKVSLRLFLCLFALGYVPGYLYTRDDPA